MEFDWIKESLIESGRVILNRSENAKIYLIKQGPTGIDDGYTVLKNEAGENYFNDIEQLEEAINSLYRNGFLGCNLSDGIRYVYEEIDHSVPTFVFDIFHEEKVYYRESDGYDILNKVKEEPIDITLVSKITLDDPKGYAIDLSTLGASGIIGGYMFANAAVEHIYGDVPEIDSSYYMIVSTGLYRMQLKAPITKEYFDAANGELEDVSGLMDSDNDGLYDFEEINLKNGLVKLDRQGNVVYPTYYDCTQAVGNKFYVDTGFEAFKRNLKISNPNYTADELLFKLENTPVLPINSDPTEDDSDNDGILDKYDVNALADNKIPDEFVNLINKEIIVYTDVLYSNSVFICLKPLSIIEEHISIDCSRLDDNYRNNTYLYYAIINDKQVYNVIVIDETIAIKYVALQILNSYEDMLRDSEDFSNKYGLGTMSEGYQGTIALGIFAFSGSVGITRDMLGNISLQISGGDGVATGAGISVSKYLTFTNCKLYSDLDGPGINIGGTGGDGVVIGGDIVLILDAKNPDINNPSNYGITFCVGPGVGGEAHIQGGYTFTIFNINIFDIHKKVLSELRKWVKNYV